MHNWAPWIAAAGAVLSAVIAAVVGLYVARTQRPKMKADATQAITEAAQDVVEMYIAQHKECKEEVDDLRLALEKERDARRRDVGRLADQIGAGDGTESNGKQ